MSTSASIGSAKSQLDEITNEQLKQLFMEAVLETDIEAERDYILSFFENLDDDKMGKLVIKLFIYVIHSLKSVLKIFIILIILFLQKNYIETAVFNKPLEDVLEFRK